MKSYLAVAVLLCLSVLASAQDNQVSASFVLKQQTKLGYEPSNLGLKIEGVYNLPSNFTLVAYATGIRSPKVDSGTGKSGFLSLGARWAPIRGTTSPRGVSPKSHSH